MDVLERAVFFAIGFCVGSILGYTISRLREVEKKMDELDKTHNRTSRKDEAGKKASKVVDFLSFGNVMMSIILFVTGYAAFTAASANKDLENTVECLTRYNASQNKVLQARDTSVKEEMQSEILLWSLYDELYLLAEKDSKLVPIAQERLHKAIVSFRDQLVQTQNTRIMFEYNNPDFLQDCKETIDE